MPIKYYHLTKPDNARPILEHGIKCSDDGFIYLVSEEQLSDICSSFDFVALYQLHIDEYQLFEIKQEGIGGKLLKEIIDGIESPCQFQLKQNKIQKSCIIDCGTRKVNNELVDKLTLRGVLLDGKKNSPKNIHCE